MAIEPSARARLDERMEEKRAYLGLRWRDVAAAAGMTYEGLRGVRKGPSAIPPFTRRALERALQWPTGEVDRILSEVDATADPADEQIVAMTLREVAEFAVRRGRKVAAQHGRERGEEARGAWLRHAMAVRDAALRALVTEVN